MKEATPHFALVLPGAVARGAYEAGVIQVIAEKDLKIDRIVATSSGALNGLAFALGIRTGHVKEMADKLVDAWVAHGGWSDVLNVSGNGLLLGRGISDSTGLINMMRRIVKPCAGSKKRNVELRIIVTPLNGVVGNIQRREATTYEKIIKFTGEDLDTPARLEKVYNVVAAACALPALFKPVEIPGLGFCVDGGAVNNAPIKYALEESGVSRIIMPVPFPAVMPHGDWKSGVGLVNHMLEILINERLYRDLKEATTVNEEIEKLKELTSNGTISQDQFETVVNALKIRSVEITQVRPKENFKSSPFAGFFNRDARVKLIEAGYNAAQTALADKPQVRI